MNEKLRKEINNENSWQWHLTFIGQYMQHNYYLYYVIDDIMLNNNIDGIVEMGTGCGALTLVLGLWGIKKNIPVLTIDNIREKSQEILPIFKALNIDSYIGDENNEKTINYIEKFIDNKKILFICDGGNKTNEFKVWSPKLSIDSIICIHDWNIECSLKNINIDLYEPYKRELWEKMNVHFSIFKKIR